MSLKEYQRKRNFSVTAEPSGGRTKQSSKKSRFVIQKHDASRLHYDFRLELGGTLVSWAVPKNIPLVKGEKRLAVKVEDHPVSYIDFEGVIPKGEYGGGTVQVWDTGTFEPLTRSPHKDLAAGKLHVELHGKKLQGEWHLVRLREENQWLIVRSREDHQKLTKAQEEHSVLSGKTLAQLAIPTSVHVKATTKKKATSEVLFIEPMKAMSLKSPPAGDWLYEIKFDGFRILAFKNGKEVQLLSRTQHDLTANFPEVAAELRTLKPHQLVLDGEVVALDDAGRSSFQLLQSYDLGQTHPPICYYAFDILELDGVKTQNIPVEKRKETLRQLLPKSSTLRYSASLGSDAQVLLIKAKELGLEGLIGKRAGSFYEAGKRSGAWIKLKLHTEQEFVIGGYTEPAGTRKFLGALLVGVYEKGKLLYAGKVGSGFSGAVLRDLHHQFQELSQSKCPFHDLPEERVGRYGQGITATVMKRCHWVNPVLVCQVRFAEWTKDGRLRQPTYFGLRADKSPQKVVREAPQ